MSVGVVLTIIFMVLKLTGFIHWTWPVVCIPLMIEGAFYVLVFFAALIKALR